MSSRREFIQSGVALGALSVPSLSVLAGTRAALSLHKVVFDGRSAAGAAFGAVAAARGASVLDTDGDISALWADHLSRRWREAPVAVAGLTSASSLFALQTVAEDPRVRVVYRVHHERVSASQMRHSQFGPAAVLANGAVSAHEDARWGREAAERVLDFPARYATVRTSVSTIAQAQRLSLPNNTLVSWVIAPVRRVAGEV